MNKPTDAPEGLTYISKPPESVDSPLAALQWINDSGANS